ncbi:MAG: hypothetical protein ACI9LN_004250, partial [Saprospiraceae bacterium]
VGRQKLVWKKEFSVFMQVWWIENGIKSFLLTCLILGNNKFIKLKKHENFKIFER